MTIPAVDMNVTHAWSKFVVHHLDRTSLIRELDNAGIEIRVNYIRPLHLQSLAYAFDIAYDPGILEGAEQFSRTCLSLPIYPELSDSEVEYIVDAVKQIAD